MSRWKREELARTERTTAAVRNKEGAGKKNDKGARMIEEEALKVEMDGVH